MRKSLLSLAPVALLALGACDNNAAPDAAATPESTDSAPMTLPPSIVDSGVYRCADKSVIYVDFYEGGKRAGIRTEQNGTPVILNAPGMANPAMAATPQAGMTPEAAVTPASDTPTLTGGSGFELIGTGQTIQVKLPGKDSQTCKTG